MKKLPLIIAPTRIRSDTGKSLAMPPKVVAAMVKNSKSIIVTDTKGLLPSKTFRELARRNGYQIHTVMQIKEEYRLGFASNNWLRMHGYPVRRKMHNQEQREKNRRLRKDKRKRTASSFMIIDEFWSAFS